MNTHTICCGPLSHRPSLQRFQKKKKTQQPWTDTSQQYWFLSVQIKGLRTCMFYYKSDIYNAISKANVRLLAFFWCIREDTSATLRNNFERYLSVTMNSRRVVQTAVWWNAQESAQTGTACARQGTSVLSTVWIQATWQRDSKLVGICSTGKGSQRFKVDWR
jgi:hypothetical protein